MFAGNRTDVTPVEAIVEQMEERHGLAQRIWFMDREMTSAENIEWLQQSGWQYLIGTATTELRRWARAIAESQDWQRVREGVEAKLCCGPEGAQRLSCCAARWSAARKRRPSTRALPQRLEEGLEKLGRLIDLVEAPSQPARVQLKRSVRPEWDDWARHSEGCYVLRTNITDWDAEQLWRTYIQLSQAEAAFRIDKSELSMRPIWHRREDRVQPHILLCFLAYALWKTWNIGKAAPGWATARALSSMNLAASRVADVVFPRWPRIRAASYAFAV